jgi:ABC-2 type transport system permease protein
MRTIFVVIKNEIYSILSKPSFWLTTFLLPLVVLALNIGTQVMVNRAVAEEQQSSPIPSETTGYVDEAGLLRRLPPDQSWDWLRAYPDEAAARAALQRGEIGQYYLIPADFMASGALIFTAERFTLLGRAPGETLMRQAVAYNLLDDPDLAAALINPTPVIHRQALAPQDEDQENNLLAFFVPLATLMIFLFVLTMTSGFMLQSVTREKENRTAEVLLLSLRPRELMLGKIVGLGCIGLLQVIIWTGGGLLALDRAKAALQMTSVFNLPPGFLLWTLGYFLLGYLLYASLLGAIGALAPTAREGGQFVFIVLLPLMIPLWLNGAFMQAPDGSLATFLSLFPLTAPVSMPTRLVAGNVPLWQPLVGLLALAATTYGVMLVAARFFRADTLLSMEALNWQRLRQEWRTPARPGSSRT